MYGNQIAGIPRQQAQGFRSLPNIWMMCAVAFILVALDSRTAHAHANRDEDGEREGCMTLPKPQALNPKP